MREANFDQHIESVRRFNRFYTQKIGVLEEGLLHSPFSLAQVRVLYELAHRDQPTAAELAKDLGLDGGYLSRTLSDFEKRGLIEKKTSEADGRQSLLLLTEQGLQAFAPLNERAQEEIGALLKTLSAPEQSQLINAMHTISRLLGTQSELQSESQPKPKRPYILRPHQPGDMCCAVNRHACPYTPTTAT